MIVGDYARKADELSGKGLSGYYASKISAILKLANFNIDRCYLTCVVKHYFKGLGSGNYGSDSKLLTELYAQLLQDETYYLKMLCQEIREIRPLVILALGEHSLRTLTGKSGITKWRGSVLTLTDEIQRLIFLPGNSNPEIKVVPAQHPATLQWDESTIYPMRLDYKKAVDLIFSPNSRVDYHECNIARNSGDLEAFLSQYRGAERMTCDIETHLGFVTCAGISFDGYKGCCIPLTGAKDIPVIEKARMSYRLAKLLADPKIAKCNQNINYDYHLLQKYGYEITPIKWDTMLAASTIAPEFPKRLDFLTSIYTDMAFYKDEGRTFDPSKMSYDVLYNYNAKDAIAAFQIWDKQRQDLEEMDLLDFFENFVMPLFTPYFVLENNGILLDVEKQTYLRNKYESLLEVKYTQLRNVVGRDLNVRSPLQVGRYFEEMRFPVYRHRTPTGKMVVSTDGNALKKMRAEEPAAFHKCELSYEAALEVINLTLLIRRIEKVIEAVNVYPHPDGRVRTSVNLVGTRSGRTSDSQSYDGMPIWEMEKGKKKLVYQQLGTAFKTVTKHGFIIEEDDADIQEGVIGKDIREMYIADPGWMFIEIDSSQAEARVVDVLAEDWEGLEEYGKLDKHCKVASLIFDDYSYEDIVRLSKKEKTEEGLFMRFIGKKGKHSVAYDTGDFQLSMVAAITRKQARVVLAKLAKAYPNIRGVFHRQVEEVLRKTRHTWNSFGRHKYWYQKIDPHYIKVAYSWIPQSTVSDNTKLSFRRGYDALDRTKVRFIVENHDSLTSLVRVGYAHRYCAFMCREMEREIDFRKCVLPRDYNLKIPAEVAFGRRAWKHLKEPKRLKLDRIPFDALIKGE